MVNEEVAMGLKYASKYLFLRGTIPPLWTQHPATLPVFVLGPMSGQSPELGILRPVLGYGGRAKLKLPSLLV